MVTLTHAGLVEVVAIGLEPGDMLLESIAEAVRKHDIQNGVVVSGIGTLRSCRMHHIEHAGFPPNDRVFAVEKPLELVSVSGIVASGQPHLHVVVSYRDEEVYAGHLENGSEVLYVAEIAVLKFNDLRMARRFDADRRISLLGPLEFQRET
ncbi:MAG: DNA-binding protein [Anaerolineae bacterium]|nr:MAG: DNA-binding protein [Anaerolineae bacterium]